MKTRVNGILVPNKGIMYIDQENGPNRRLITFLHEHIHMYSYLYKRALQHDTIHTLAIYLADVIGPLFIELESAGKEKTNNKSEDQKNDSLK